MSQVERDPLQWRPQLVSRGSISLSSRQPREPFHKKTTGGIPTQFLSSVSDFRHFFSGWTFLVAHNNFGYFSWPNSGRVPQLGSAG